jgi:hypothetical protein
VTTLTGSRAFTHPAHMHPHPSRIPPATTVASKDVLSAGTWGSPSCRENLRLRDLMPTAADDNRPARPVPRRLSPLSPSFFVQARTRCLLNTGSTLRQNTLRPVHQRNSARVLGQFSETAKIPRSLDSAAPPCTHMTPGRCLSAVVTSTRFLGLGSRLGTKLSG